MLIFFILALCFLAVTIIASALVPFFFNRYATVHKEQAKKVSVKLEDMFVWVEEKKIVLYLFLGPLIFGIIFLVLFWNPFLVLAGAVVGLIMPVLVLKQLQNIRRAKFGNQLVDALVNLSQSLKAGLSFIQALEVLVEDMPPPISQELALVAKENKMGVSLETSFERLNARMASDDLNLMVTAILVARETGGNLTDVFTHLSENIRMRKKINDQIKTLTTQARWQGVIMSLLPIIFAFFIFQVNPDFFDIMMESALGRMLLIWCVVSEVLGAFILNHFSKVEV